MSSLGRRHIQQQYHGFMRFRLLQTLIFCSLLINKGMCTYHPNRILRGALSCACIIGFVSGSSFLLCKVLILISVSPWTTVAKQLDHSYSGAQLPSSIVSSETRECITSSPNHDLLGALPCEVVLEQ